MCGSQPVNAPETMNTIYFILIGWWIALLWVVLALLVCCTIIGVPAGMAMLHKTPELAFGEV